MYTITKESEESHVKIERKDGYLRYPIISVAATNGAVMAATARCIIYL